MMTTNSSGPAKRPIRVLHVVGSMNKGGVETWLMNVLRNVDREELAFDFMVHRPDSAAYDDELQALGAGRYVCRWPNNPLTYARDFFRILKEHGPYDVIHSHVHHFSGFVLLLSKIAGVSNRIVHSHSDTLSLEKKISSLRRLYLTITKKLIFSLATSGIAVSERAAIALFGDQWRRNDKWSIISCGVDAKTFTEIIDPVKIRKDLGLQDDEYIVGHVGRFDEVKNHSFLIDIFKNFVNSHPQSMLLLVGDGPLKKTIKEKVINLELKDKVIFLGVRDDVPKIMRGAMDVFLFPSKYEGLGLSLIEAQVAGLPCIASDQIPPEAGISNLCRFLPLSDPIDAWCVAISPSENSIRSNPIYFRDFSLDTNIDLLSNLYSAKFIGP